LFAMVGHEVVIKNVTMDLEKFTLMGFLVNRFLHIMWIEANRLVEEGFAPPEGIDAACKLVLGHPLEPMPLLNSSAMSYKQILFETYGERFPPRQF
jgi:3-hydroxyacyl-CoA dehydrogenase